MRSSDREQLKRDIKAVAESSLEDGADGDNHVIVSVNVLGAAGEQAATDTVVMPKARAKQSNKPVRKRLNPNLLVDRLFRFGLAALMLSVVAYWMYLNRYSF